MHGVVTSQLWYIKYCNDDDHDHDNGRGYDDDYDVLFPKINLSSAMLCLPAPGDNHSLQISNAKTSLLCPIRPPV